VHDIHYAVSIPHTGSLSIYEKGPDCLPGELQLWFDLSVVLAPMAGLFIAQAALVADIARFEAESMTKEETFCKAV
jgi:hypothetical protein